MLAMLFLLILSTLAIGMFGMATMNVQTARNYSDANRARATAESGLRWASWRLKMMNRPKTPIGTITPAVAASLWPSVRQAVIDDFALMSNSTERPVSWDGTTLKSSSVATDASAGRFVVSYQMHPLNVSDTLDQRYIRVTSTGTYGNAIRALWMDFMVDKKVKFAIVGKVPIQIGRNTIVEGPMAMATPGKFPPFLLLSDFRHVKPSLQTKIDNFNAFLAANHNGYDNRIDVNNPVEYQKAVNAGYSDYTNDGFIDEYDLFIKEFDSNGDRAVTAAEFTDPATGKLYDADLFKAIDMLGGPLQAGDPTRVGYQDNKIDASDGYTKVRGSISIASTAAAWQSNLSGSGQGIDDYMQGPVMATDSSQQPIIFGADSSQIFDLSPSNFDTSGFYNKTGPQNGTTSKTATIITNAVLSAADANNGTAVERTPFGSTSYQATYQRPVFKNITFRNCRIPIGLNALFDNCSFEGVTYVGMTTNITDSGGSTTTNASAGMTWAQQMKSGSFSTATTLTASNSYGFTKGNNLRFNNCTMKGPIASDVPTAYTHFSNSWEFTGATLFNNVADQTATIIAPQTNIEMGSFTDPAQAPSTLIGVVVVGNIDIRGSSFVDGSIIVTGDGAGNTTQGWFGPSDAATDVTTPMPEGGFGRLNIRYNPTRALPDGINVPIDILPDSTTYTEVGP